MRQINKTKEIHAGAMAFSIGEVNPCCRKEEKRGSILPQ